MKLSVGAIVAFAAAVLAKPMFLNSAYNLQEDVPFTLKWGDAEGPVTITLMTGNDPNNLQKVTDIASGQTGTEFTWVPKDLPSGTYAFRITDSTGEVNYSPSFDYSGTGSLPTTTGSTSVPSTSTSASSTSPSSTSEKSSTSTTSSSTSASTTSSTTTTSSSSTLSTSTTPTTTRQASTTTAPPNSNNGQRFASPLALVLLTVAALVFFN